MAHHRMIGTLLSVRVLDVRKVATGVNQLWTWGHVPIKSGLVGTPITIYMFPPKIE